MTDSQRDVKQKILSSVLASTRIALLREILDEWSPKLGVDGAAKVITNNVEIAETLAQWTQDSYRDQPYSITILEDNVEKGIDPNLQKLATISTTKRIPDDSSTHGFSHINVYDRHAALWVFKRIFYALIPKGIAVVTCFRQNAINDILVEVLASQTDQGSSKPQEEEIKHCSKDGDLADLAEEAQFERGKIRSYQKHVIIKGGDLDSLVDGIIEKLEENLGPCDSGSGWRLPVQEALKQRTEQDGSLRINAELVLAMRWDLLNA